MRARFYGENGDTAIGRFAFNWTGSGECSITHTDGEKFTGQYTTIAPELYTTELSILLGSVGRGGTFVALAPRFGTVSSNIQYGLISAVGDRGTTGVCKYIVTIRSLFSSPPFTFVGTCLDSKGRKYTMHSMPDAKFDEADEQEE